METIGAMLMVVVVMGGDHPDIRYEQPMPDRKVCMEEALRFLNYDFPEFVDAKEVKVACVAPAIKGKDT